MGWFISALVNTHLCQIFSPGSMLLLGASLQVLAQALRAWKPPFGLFVVTFWLTSLGQAIQDTTANTFVAGVKVAHRWLAFIHAMYMAGCLCGPFAATAVASADMPSRWYLFYLVPLVVGLANVALTLAAFRDTVTIKRTKPRDNESTGAVDRPAMQASRNQGAMKLIKGTVTTPSVWLLSLFFFFFLGVSLTASGWVVEYLVIVRDGDLKQMGYVPAGFSGGALLGRLFLAEPTHRFGERRMIFGLSVLGVASQLVFWL